MNKNSQKVKKRKNKRILEINRKRRQMRKKKKSLYIMNAEKRKLRKNFEKINQIEEEKKERTDEIINTRRALRERYLNSLKVNNLKILQAAKQDMLRYEIALKLEEQKDENVMDRN